MKKIILLLIISIYTTNSFAQKRPNIILVMSDDQGWGQTSYNNHPILKTPNIDAMAENGIRLDRFYATPVCSTSRATVLTGRSNDRTGVFNHGFPLRLQEKTIAQALKEQGYKTAHFGKWHLSGLKGPGAPILKENNRNPTAFGFDEWVTVSNYFDSNPIMSHNGEIKEYKGSSSDIIVKLALKYIAENQDKPLFIVIWYGSPHTPHIPLGQDKKELPKDLASRTKNYLGEVVEIDKSIGLLRKDLAKMGLSENTLLWFNSDNGGLKQDKNGVGGLRGHKFDVYEGGLRVPCVIEWPSKIKKGIISTYPASTMDIFPTIADLLNLPKSIMIHPVDGMSISPVLFEDTVDSDKFIPFKFENVGALIKGNYKLVCTSIEQKNFELYNLDMDKTEANDISNIETKKAKELIQIYSTWLASVNNSVAGNDYKDGLFSPDPKPQQKWHLLPEYENYFKEWKDRPEYRRLK
jgi:arylsulfatase A-like enzyme